MKLTNLWPFGMRDSQEDRLLNVLDRSVAIDGLGGILASFSASEAFDLKHSAIVIDTNILLRLPNSRSYDDILDYLGGAHLGPIVIPGQVIQEFWNNHLHSVVGSGEKVKRTFESFQKGVKDELDAPTLTEFEKLCEEFKIKNAQYFDEGWLEKARSMLDLLSQRAEVSYVNRPKFIRLAEVRKQTKTPPGFKDDLYGDFYVWADGLLGVLKNTSATVAISQVVFVTEDKKKDWSTKDKPHPILHAEVMALFGVGLQLLDIHQLAKAIDVALGSA
ncbi:hypothetical protein BH11ARM1_BH11ARM1_02770 [soil metagenome]